MSRKIMIIEDEEDIRDLLCYNLERENFQVITVADGAAALPAIIKEHPDLVLLDLMLPGMSGLDICRQVRRDSDLDDIAVIMVTAKGEESDVVAGLELGADDYITKPFSIKVLLARVRALLRRGNAKSSPDDKTVIRRGPLEIHPDRHEVRLDGKPVDLTVSEFRVLCFMARHPGWVRTREQIIDAVRGIDYAVTERSVDVQIVGLRRKLGRHADLLETVRGVGYRFKEQP